MPFGAACVIVPLLGSSAPVALVVKATVYFAFAETVVFDSFTETPDTGLAATRENVVPAERSDEVDTVRVWEPVNATLPTSAATTCTVSPLRMAMPPVSRVTDAPETLAGHVVVDWPVDTSVTV